MTTVALIRCKCPHKFQDEQYGIGIRVHNLVFGGRNSTRKGWRCTVCLDKKDFAFGIKNDVRKS